jgi:hypothetical protein
VKKPTVKSLEKPRPQAKLKNLPAARQEEIVEWCETPKSPGCVGGQKYALEQIIAAGIDVCASTVSNFYNWYKLRRNFREAHELSKTVEELVLKVDPAAIERARALGEYTFIHSAISKEDPKLFQLVAGVSDDRRKIELREQLEPQKLALSERRVRVQEQRIADTKATVESPELTSEQKVARLQEIFAVL